MKRFIFSICCMFIFTSFLGAQNEKMLENSISVEQLQNVLVKDASWVNYPSYADREGWLNLPETIKKNILKAGEKALSYQWKPDLATDYLEFKRSGKILTGRKNHLTLNTLVLAELVEGKGRFIDAIINGAWFLCEVTWMHSAHLRFQKDRSGLPDPNEPTVELVVADIGAQMAWIHYFFHEEFDKISPLIAKRIKDTVYERLIDPYFARTDYWWMGFSGSKVNNWNIWINYNVLQAVMLLDENPEIKAKHVYQIMRSADFFIDVQKEDGACEEGPTYFGHAGANLIKFLDLVERATDGNVNIYSKEKIKNVGSYIRRVNIHDQYFVNFSDAAGRCTVAPGPIYQYGKKIGDKQLMSFASDAARKNNWINGLHSYNILARVLDDMFMAREVLEGDEYRIDETSFYFKDSELAMARDSKRPDQGFYFAAHGSHNDVAHNHNDVGSCMLYYNGEPVLMDIGVGVYTRQTFSSERYTIFTMQSGYHNLPTINGTDQHAGKEYCAKNVSFSDRGKHVNFTADIAAAYTDEAQVKSWIRSYTLKRGRKFVVTDEWQLNKVTGDNILNFITICTPEVADGCVLLKGADFTIAMKYDKKSVEPIVENIILKDSKLKKSWQTDILYRIRMKIKNMDVKGKTQITFQKN